MPIILTEDEMNDLIDHLRLESRVSYYRDELEDLHDVVSAFGDDEDDYDLAVEEAETAYHDADEALQNSDYFPADAFDGTPHFGNLCTRADIWTMEHGDVLPKKRLRELVENYLQENT